VFAWRQKSGSRFALSACCLVGLLCCRLAAAMPSAGSRRCACMTSPCWLPHAPSWVCAQRCSSCDVLIRLQANAAIRPCASPTRHGREQQGLPVSGTVAAVNLDGGRCRVLALQAFSSAVYTGRLRLSCHVVVGCSRSDLASEQLRAADRCERHWVSRYVQMYYYILRDFVVKVIMSSIRDPPIRSRLRVG